MNEEKPELNIVWVEDILKLLLESADGRALAYATIQAMKYAGIEKPLRFQTCACCGGQYDYAKKWADEHPMEMAYGILKYYHDHDKNTIRETLKAYAAKFAPTT